MTVAGQGRVLDPVAERVTVDEEEQPPVESVARETVEDVVRRCEADLLGRPVDAGTGAAADAVRVVALGVPHRSFGARERLRIDENGLRRAGEDHQGGSRPEQ